MKHSRLTNLLAVVFAASAAFADPGDGYAKRFAVTPGSPLGLSATTSLADFPVLVRLSTDISGFDYGDFENAALQAGETIPSNLDILFVDENGTTLPYEIQAWDPAGTSLVWVKVPALTVNTAITCYFGNATATASNTPTDTWSAYAGAWHFDEVGEGGTSADSTANGFTATCTNPDGSKFTTGLPSTSADPLGAGGYRENVGKRTVEAGDLANGTGSGVVFEGSQNLHPSDATHFTLSAWFRRNHTNKGWDHLFYKKNDSRGNNTDGKDWGMEFNGDTTGKIRVFGQWEANPQKSAVELNHGISQADTWYYLSIVYDGYDRRIYRNGTLLSSGRLGDPQTWFLPHWDRTDLKMALGSDSDQDGSAFQGAFDEVRLRFVSYDAEWAKAEYETMASAASLAYSAVSDTTAATPAIEDVTVTRDANGVFSVSVTLAADSASGAVDVIVNETDTVPVAASADAGDTVTGALTLAADRSYSVRAILTDAATGMTDTKSAPAFITGTVTVTGNGDAKEENLVPGGFTFSRPATAATYELAVAYVVSGTAVPGSAYETLSGTVTFPAGAATVSVPVAPMQNAILDEDVDVVASVAPGLYTPSPDAATVTIVNCRDINVMSYARRVRGTVVGYTADAALADFPLKIALSEDIDGFSYSDFQRSGGGDLAVTDDFGNFLDFEIGAWRTGGTSEVWVKAPSLTAGMGLYVLYDSASPAATATTGVSTLPSDGSAEWTSATAAMNADPAAFTVFGTVQSINTSLITITAPAVVFDGDEVAVSVDLRNGSGSVSVTFEDENGQALVREIAASATSPATLVKPLSELNLPVGLWYTVKQASAVGVDTSTDAKTGSDLLYAGTLTASRVLDAYEYGLAKGRFRIAIDGGLTTSSALTALYAVGGTATAGTEYAALSGTATIPAGASYVDVPVTPRDNGASGDTTLTLALAAGTGASPVSVDTTAATIAIKDESAQTGLGNFRKRRWLTADFYEEDETLANFPALIRLREGVRGFTYDDFDDREGGADLAFADADGNLIPHEIESWDPDGESAVWVKIPELERGTRIRMLCGGPALAVNTASIWSAYKGVWHLNDPADAATFANAQGTDMAGDNHGTTRADGIVGPARRISAGARNADDQNSIEFPSTNARQAIFNYNNAHKNFSLWLKYPTDQTPGNDIITKQQWNEGDPMGWTIRLNGNATQLTTTGSNQIRTSDNVFDNLCDGKWHHLVVVYDTTSRYIYTDGELRARMTDVAAIDGNWSWQPMGWGGYPNGGRISFKGWMDELRFGAGVYPAPVETAEAGVYAAPALVRAEYLNVTHGFFRIGNPATILMFQ